MTTPEPPLSPPLWWECENECGKCRERLCPRREEPEDEYYIDTTLEANDFAPESERAKRMKE